MREDIVNLPALETLEPRLLLSGALESALGDFGNSLNQAEEVAVLADKVTEISGQVASRRDRDYIEFVAPGTGGLQVTMDGSAGLNALLMAYNSRGRRVAYNNNMARRNPDAQMNLFVQAGQTYYIRAQGYRSTGEYDLSLALSEDLDSSVRGAATALTVSGDSTTVHHSSINYFRDRDMFRFAAVETGGLSIGMQADGSRVDSLLFVYNSAGRRIAFNNNAARGTRNAGLSLKVQAGQTYYVCAQARGRVTGDYRLQLDLDVDEDGGSRPGATSLTLAADDTVTVTRGIEYRRDVDFFSFTADGDGGVTVNMARDGSSVDSFLMVYNAQGRRIAINNNYRRGSRDAQTSFVVQDGQTYYVRTSALGRRTGNYELTLTHSLDEHANHPHQAQSVTISAEAATSLSGGIDYRFDRDFFTFIASDTGGMTVNMNSAEGSNLDTMLFVFNDAGRRITYNDDVARGNTDSRVDFRVQAGQRYYLGARGWRFSQGQYDLTFALDADEQGNNIAGAQSIVLDENGNATVAASFEYLRDVDFFTFTADQSTEMLVRMRNVDSSIRPFVAVYNTRGRRITYSVGSHGGATAVRFDVTGGQQYFVQTASLSRRGRGDYTLDFDMVVDDHSNGVPGATELRVTSESPTTASGVIDYAYDLDYFTFTAAESGGLSVTMEASPGSNLDTYLTIRRAGGSRITYNDDSGGTLNSAVSFYVEAGQTYYVQAHAYSSSQGAYNLTLTMLRDDYGGSLATAGELTLDENGAGVLNGSLQFGGDVDYVSFFATHTAEMSLSLARTGGSVQPRLSLYNSSGQLLASGVGTSSVPASASFLATEGAKYYARLSSAGASDTGSYRLAVQTSIPAPAPEPNPDLPDPTPGAVVAANVYNTGSGLILRVLGTNHDDVIILRQTAGSVSVSGSLTYNYNHSVDGIEIYGFDGADVLRTTYSVTADALIYAGDGADTIYENGQGRGVSYGQDGNDRIVTIGGGQDSATGGAGLDSFWIDSTDTVSDATGMETAARSVHVVSTFYQPYSSNPSHGDYVSLNIAGQNFRDPTPTSSSYTYRNFSHLDVFNNGPQYDDINQGSVGDCYFLAAVSSLAQQDPTILEQMITSLGDGTYAVRYYNGSSEVYLRIDGDLPTYSSNNLVYARTSGTNEIWVPLIEKAYAHFRYEQNTYASISGGWMDDVYRQVTGMGASFRYTSGTVSALATYLRDNLNAGHAVTLGSYSGASSPVVGSHAYQVVSVDANNYVTVYNPWGVDGRSWDGNYNDGLLRLSIRQIQSNYVGICVSAA